MVSRHCKAPTDYLPSAITTTGIIIIIITIFRIYKEEELGTRQQAFTGAAAYGADVLSDPPSHFIDALLSSLAGRQAAGPVTRTAR